MRPDHLPASTVCRLSIARVSTYVALAAVFCFPPVRAQQANAVRDDLYTLFSAPFGVRDSDPEVEDALRRALSDPSPYLAALGDTLTLPPSLGLLDYPIFVSSRSIRPAVYLTFLIADSAASADGRSDARGLLRSVYEQSAADSDSLWAQHSRMLDAVGRPPPATPEIRQLRQALGAAVLVSTLTLEYLGRAGDASLIESTRARYWRASYSDRGSIRAYGIAITGTFEEPPVVEPPPPVNENADIRPILECVAANADGSFTAFFGFENRHGSPVMIPFGTNNRITPAAYDRRQPQAFRMPNVVPGRPGRTPFYPGHAYTVTFQTGQQVVWKLGRRTSTASTNPVQRCPTN